MWFEPQIKALIKWNGLTSEFPWDVVDHKTASLARINGASPGIRVETELD
jgi:hypothetical protein